MNGIKMHDMKGTNNKQIVKMKLQDEEVDYKLYFVNGPTILDTKFLLNWTYRY